MGLVHRHAHLGVVVAMILAAGVVGCSGDTETPAFGYKTPAIETLAGPTPTVVVVPPTEAAVSLDPVDAALAPYLCQFWSGFTAERAELLPLLSQIPTISDKTAFTSAVADLAKLRMTRDYVKDPDTSQPWDITDFFGNREPGYITSLANDLRLAWNPQAVLVNTLIGWGNDAFSLTSSWVPPAGEIASVQQLDLTRLTAEMSTVCP
jgi:hypothetical protein